MKTIFDMQIVPAYQESHDDPEKILWSAKPAFWPYFASHIAYNAVFLLVSALMIYLLYTVPVKSLAENESRFMMWVSTLALGVAGVRGLILALYNFPGSRYSYSKQGLTIYSGFKGKHSEFIPFYQISDIELKYNWLQRKLRIGSLVFTVGRINTTDNLVLKKFAAIASPEVVFKHLSLVKQIAEAKPQRAKKPIMVVVPELVFDSQVEEYEHMV